MEVLEWSKIGFRLNWLQLYAQKRKFDLEGEKDESEKLPNCLNSLMDVSTMEDSVSVY